MPPPVFRFAPSPNGYLHLGHAYSALLNFDMARQSGGTLLLRIEDIDTARCRPEFEDAIYEDLAWLGITWQQPVRRQSEHLVVYREAIERLTRDGLVYPAFESRSEIAQLIAARDALGPWPRDPDGTPLYPGGARDEAPQVRDENMRAGLPYALRLDMEAARKQAEQVSWRPFWVEEGSGPAGETGRVTARPQAWGDVIVARKDTPTSYHVSVVIDDAQQEVTHVVRGRDLFWATSVHRLLQDLLGLPAPRYGHHGLILDESGDKLSKSTQATALRELRESGETPEDIRRRVGLSPAK
jgi:glutamyl-Q tRNA(Asp) synthetase